MSGAGSIKLDASDDDYSYEIKDANKQFTLKGKELLVSWQQAIREGRDVKWIIYFTDADITAELTITKGKH